MNQVIAGFRAVYRDGNSDLQDLRFLASAETRLPGRSVILETPSKFTLEVHTDPAFCMPSPVPKLRAFGPTRSPVCEGSRPKETRW
jgi:hypothetical protein